MIHHISTAVRDPLHVSQVLAEILQGQSIPFPGHRGSYIALAFDAYGTMIELHPIGAALVPGNIIPEADKLLQNPTRANYSANHVAISVPINIAQIQAIATREGWQMVYCNRGDRYFEVVELWIENQFLIELLSPEILDKYLDFMAPESLIVAAQAAMAAAR